MPITGTALKSVVRLSTEQTSRSRKDTASGAEIRRSLRRAAAVFRSTGTSLSGGGWLPAAGIHAPAVQVL